MLYALTISSFLLLVPCMSFNCDLFIHSPVEGHLGCFKFLTLISKAAVNIHLKVLVWMCSPWFDCGILVLWGEEGSGFILCVWAIPGCFRG